MLVCRVWQGDECCSVVAPGEDCRAGLCGRGGQIDSGRDNHWDAVFSCFLSHVLMTECYISMYSMM